MLAPTIFPVIGFRPSPIVGVNLNVELGTVIYFFFVCQQSPSPLQTIAADALVAVKAPIPTMPMAALARYLMIISLRFLSMVSQTLSCVFRCTGERKGQKADATIGSSFNKWGTQLGLRRFQARRHLAVPAPPPIPLSGVLHEPKPGGTSAGFRLYSSGSHG